MSANAIEGFRLSLQQERLWRLSAGGRILNSRAAFALRGALDISRLETALHRAVERHEILRTVFRQLEGMTAPIQVISEEGPAMIRADLSSLEPEARSRRFEELWLREAETPFDLANGPSVRFALLRISTDESILLMTVPALCADGRTLRGVMAEIGDGYGGETEDEGPVQYVDFSEWQHQLLGEDDAEEGRSYWSRRWPRGLAVHAFPPGGDQAVSDEGDGRSATREALAVCLDPELVTAAEALAGSLEAGLGDLLLALWAVLLGRATGRTESVVGRRHHGRKFEELESAFGLFALLLPFRFDLDGRRTVNDLLRQAASRAAEAEEWLEYFQWPEESGGAVASRFRTAFSEERWPEEIVSPGLRIAALRLESPVDRFDVGLTVVRRARDVTLEVSFDPRRFGRETAERLAERYLALTRNAVGSPGRPVSELEILSPAERREVLVECNRTGGGEAPARPLPQLIAARAVSEPDRPALRYGGEELTFGELEEWVAGLAEGWAASGVGPERRVGVLLERSLEWVVAPLAVMRSGGAFVAMDPWQPGARLRAIAGEADLGWLVTRPAAARGLDLGAGVELLEIEDPVESVAIEGAPPRSAAEHLAYLMFTSGSTGRPKGVLVEHRSVSNLWQALRESIYGDAEGLRVSVNAPLSFDASIKQLVQLASGHTLVVVPEEVRPDGEALLSFLIQEGIDVLDTTPSQLRLLLSAGLEGSAGGPRTILVGGEAIDDELWSRLAADGTRRYFNVYGPTECTVDVTVRPVDGPRPLLGGPLRNVRAYVLDTALLPVGIGWEGELHVGGAGVSRGYVGRPGETARRFLPDPFGGVAGGRLYATGDRACRRSDGSLEYVGRRDHQVKLRGVRVELGEIESVLRDHPAVAEAAVVVREDRPGDPRLVAYLSETGEAAGKADPAQLRAWTLKRLPEAMTPGVFLVLDVLPLNRNGKVDRAALPAPEDVETAPPPSSAPPVGPIEEVLATIWSEVLGVEEVGRDRSFFELGGHSLLATQLMSRIRRSLSVEIPLRALFEQPTVAGLAAKVDRELGAAHGLALPPIEPAPRDQPLPLSFTQERFWFVHRLGESDRSLYNARQALRLEGPLDVAALGAALSDVVRRHEVLRTRFVEVESEPRAEILAAEPLPLPIVDLRALDEGRRLGEAEGLAREEGDRPFDLARGPVLRAVLLRLSEDDTLCALTLHHVVVDAWSLGIFIDEAAASYEAFTARRRPALPELPIQYADYAAWQRRYLRGEALETLLDYWRTQLGGMPPALELPYDRPRWQSGQAGGDRVMFHLPAALVEPLSAVGRGRNATLAMTMLTPLKALLHRYTHQSDILVGTLIAGRTRVELEGLIGCFLNNLVLRTELGGDPTASRVLDRVFEVSLEAFAHQDLPFERLVEELQPDRRSAFQPLLQVMYVFQNAPRSSAELAGLTLTPLEPEAPHPRFDLVLILWQEEDGLAASVEYDAGLFDAATIRRLTGHYRTLAAAMAADPETRLSALPLLSPAERHQLARERNEHAAGVSEPPFVEVFEERARCRPDAVAIVAGDETLTYGGLERRAGRLAAALAERGLAAEEVVGIALERSPAWVPAILAVWKLGVAYAPFDPEYPPERVRVMMEDVPVRLLLTGEGLRERFDEYPGDVLTLEEALAEDREPLSTRPAALDGLAYVIFTSGSTGRPKAVALNYRGLSNLMALQERFLGVDEGSRVLQLYSFSFDGSVWDVVHALAHGAALFMAMGEARLPGPALLDHLARHRIDCAVLPPAMLSMLSGDRLPGLGTVLSVGEACTAEIVAGWARERRLINAYGPTEITVTAAMNDCVPDGRTPPFGRPLFGVEIQLLDGALRPVPVGVSGEICLGGVGLARGYLERPALTARSFVPNPLSTVPGARLYRTGDLAFALADGRLEYVGRIDRQSKIRGFRVELEEIEATLGAHAGVRDAVVVVRDENRGGFRDQRLVAYAVLDGGEAPSREELQRGLREKLPGYMVPSAVMILSSLPLTPNGKVDLAALPAPEQAPFVAPRNPIESRLAEIWKELLAIDQVGVHDDFFALGGHSLLATRLLSRARRAFEVELPLATLFEHSGLAEMAAAVEREMVGGEDLAEMDELLGELEGMSEEEVRTLLAEDQGGALAGALEGRRK